LGKREVAVSPAAAKRIRIFDNTSATTDLQVNQKMPTLSARSRGKRGDQKEQALGYSQGGFSTKVHIRSEGRGKPMVFYLSEGQRNEMVGFWPLMENGQVHRAGRGRLRFRSRRICADKGYAKGVLRRYLRRLGIRITIAKKEQ
jgi:hypothetical protein